MKLLPKARPVQINKLKLQGAEINSIDELKKHFYVWDIIALGNKFIMWLDRNDDTRAYSKRVSDIFNSQKGISTVALSLISTFFDHPAISIVEEIKKFKQSGANDGVLASIFKCQDPDESTAISLLSDKTYREAQWIKPWLLRCADIPGITPELQYLLAYALKDYHCDTAKKLIAAARAGGCTEPCITNLEDRSISINIAEVPIVLNRVSFHSGDFYITRKLLPSWLFKELHVNPYGGKKGNSCSFHGFKDLLQELSFESGYKWDFPTIDEWIEAINAKAFTKSTDEIWNWCKSGTHKMAIGDQFNYICKDNSYELYSLRAVIRISQNPQLQ